MALAVDASVALKWVLPEPDSHHALALLRSEKELLVPDFWLNEATNVLWLQVHRQRWTAEQARTGLDLLKAAVAPIETGDLGLHPAALDIGLAVGHSPYDGLYAAFAIAMGAERLVVADGPFHTAMQRHPDHRLSKLLLPLREWADSAGV